MGLTGNPNSNAENSGFGIVIVAHGGLADQFLATLQHVIGQQERIAAVSIEDKDNREEKQNEIAELAKLLDIGSGVIVVTDMFGGTPSNLAIKLLPRENTRILFGVNMPALIKLARSRKKPIDEAVIAATEAGHRYLNFCTKSRGE